MFIRWFWKQKVKVIRAEGCVRAAEQLKKRVLIPDLICAHPGWGEPLFLKASGRMLLCFVIKNFFIMSMALILILILNFKRNVVGILRQNCYEECLFAFNT